MCAKEHAGWLAHVLGVSEPVQCGLVRVPACARQRAPAATRTPPQLTHSDDQFACAEPRRPRPQHFAQVRA